jgi:hypothetical protein
MIRRSHRSLISLACLALVALPLSTVSAADKTKVDEATQRVEQGAKRIGEGKVGSGFKQMFAGIGHTVVEGAKFSGATIGEFFKKTFRS